MKNKSKNSPVTKRNAYNDVKKVKDFMEAEGIKNLFIAFHDEDDDWGIVSSNWRYLSGFGKTLNKAYGILEEAIEVGEEIRAGNNDSHIFPNNL